MTTIEQLSEAARRLTPDELRSRLTDLDREARIVRALLRAALRSQRDDATQAGEPSRQEAAAR